MLRDAHPGGFARRPYGVLIRRHLDFFARRLGDVGRERGLLDRRDSGHLLDQ
jgi:hypothetical protein